MSSSSVTPAATAPSMGAGRTWAGRILQALVVLFLLFDAVTKVFRSPQVMKAAAQLGFTPREIVTVGGILLICTLLYVIPRTAILGAVLLTGYLGGAVAVAFHARMPVFETLFPFLFGVLVWLALYLRHPRLGGLLSGASNL